MKPADFPDFEAFFESCYKDAVASIGGVVVCSTCMSTKPCPPEQAAIYLRKGWPRCCEETMELVKLST